MDDHALALLLSGYAYVAQEEPANVNMPSQPPPAPPAPRAQQFQFKIISPEEAAAIRQEDTENGEKICRRCEAAMPLPQHNYSEEPEEPEEPEKPEDPEELHRCHPPNLEKERRLAVKDADWKYKCDLCGHSRRYRTEFHRHFADQPGVRNGFRVISTKTDTNPTWFGKDAAGNEYMGQLILSPRIEGQKRSGYSRCPAPCGPRLRDSTNATYRGKAKAKAIAEKEQKKAGNTEADRDVMGAA